MDKLYRKLLVASLAFFVIAMVVLVVFNNRFTTEDGKTPTNALVTLNADKKNPEEGDEAADVEEETTGVSAEAKETNESGSSQKEPSSYEIEMVRDDSKGRLEIVLPDDLTAKDITVENHYMDSKMVVSLAGVDAGFFKEHPIVCGDIGITKGVFVSGENSLKLEFALSGIYEPQTIFENNILYISLNTPREAYDKIIVIDPSFGGSATGQSVELEDAKQIANEKDITLKIATVLKKKLDLYSDVKAYFTRLDDVNPQDEMRVRLANETKADMYILLSTDYSEDTSKYGITSEYNEEYFIPGFGSVALSDALESEVTIAVKGKALGIINGSNDDYCLKHATVPATRLRVGYLSNPQEAILLNRDDYIEKIADGIYNGIMKAYEAKGE